MRRLALPEALRRRGFVPIVQHAKPAKNRCNVSVPEVRRGHEHNHGRAVGRKHEDDGAHLRVFEVQEYGNISVSEKDGRLKFRAALRV